MVEIEPTITVHEETPNYQPVPRRPFEVFGFSEDECVSWRVGEERFLEILTDGQTVVHEIEETDNQFGSFLFLKASRPSDQGRVIMSFYGLGYHEYRERHILDEWYWYQGSPRLELLRKQIGLDDVLAQLGERKENLEHVAEADTQTDRGRLFELLADLTDEDGALAEIQDIEDIAGMLELLSDQVEEDPDEPQAAPQDDEEQPTPLYELGQIVATPGAIDALIASEQLPGFFLQRHQVGDWGELDEEDVEQNNLAVEQGLRVLSAYKLESGIKIWIITEWDRSVTTILLPSEY